MASGSEVHLMLDAGNRLAREGVAVRVVSFPSWELFEAQDPGYQEQVLPTAWKRRVALEAGVAQGWERWVTEHGFVIGLARFGASAPYQEIYENLGLTPEAVVEAARRLLETMPVRMGVK